MDRREYARRRRRVVESLDDTCIVIVPTAPVMLRNRDVEYPFRPDSDFYYLTGFAESEAVAVMIPGREQGEYLLFCRERDSRRDLWTGRCVGLEDAVSKFGADDAFPVSDLDDILPGLMEGRSKVYYPIGKYADFDYRVLNWANRLRRQRRGRYSQGSAEIVALDHILHDMRLYKSAAELRTIRHAVDASVAGHKRAMAASRPGLHEYQLEAEVLHEFARHGCRWAAYPSIVAGGVNGCVMHYTDNGALLNDGDLVLLDAGAEYQFYAGDVTRTFPVNGRFSPVQRAIYELVLSAQQAAIDVIRPGNDCNAPHRAAVAVIAAGLADLGVIPGPARTAGERSDYQHFYMPSTGHWLGLDVHDVGDYKVEGAWRAFEPGMVTTVEPGVYIPPDATQVAPRWRGIAVRIEDDVAVTRHGREVLSAALPKAVNAVEALSGASDHDEAG
ncbi:MAG: M24 family metallopeptidase [Gammaproteobacteria bacterium]|nr:M24 family metallopeptidase [Gammaproteobacteria bacterium]